MNWDWMFRGLVGSIVLLLVMLIVLETPIVSYYFRHNAFVQKCIDSQGTLVANQYFDACMVNGGKSGYHTEFQGPYYAPFHAPNS